MWSSVEGAFGSYQAETPPTPCPPACIKGIGNEWHVPLTWVRALCSQVEVSGDVVRLGYGAGEATAVTVVGSCTIDALHSGSSHPKAVWWQNAAASSEGEDHDAAAYVLRSDH